MTKTLLPGLTLLISLVFSAPAMMAAPQQHDRDNDQNWETRNGYEYHVYTEHPQGWNRGEETKWENCGGPDEARRYGCRTYVYEGRHYYYYSGQDGRIYVRRPADEHHDHDHDRDDH